MRNRLPAALLLLLSWFLPVTPHAPAVQQVAAVAQAPSWRAEQQHSGLRQVPPPLPAVRGWAGPGSATGAAAVLAAEPQDHRAPWSVLVTGPAADSPTARRPLAAAARAPPHSTAH